MTDVSFTLEEVAAIVDEVKSDDLLSVGEVALRFDVALEKVQLWASEGLLPARMVGGQFVFRLGDVVEWELNGLRKLAAGPEGRALETVAPAGGAQ